MEDTIVSFEVAKLAKEKGFTDVVGVFRGKHYYNYKGELDADQMDYLKAYVRQEDTSLLESIAAPTQSLLQKWLREKQYMYVLVHYDGCLFDVSIYGQYAPTEIIIQSFIQHEPTFYTYEEALEVGLKEGLQLI